MARCNSCSGVITKTDVKCYVCGEPVPGRAKSALFRFFWAKPAPPAPKRAPVKEQALHANQDAPRTS
jgi:hypothetical protein